MIKKKDLSIEETFALAIQNQQNNDFIVAEKLYNEIIKRDPNYVNAHINLGILLIQNKKYHNAIISFEKAIELNPNFADTYYNVAVVNNLLGQNLDAIQNYEKAIQLNPKFLNAMNNLGVVFLENNEYQKAVDYFQKVILINPNISNAHNNLGSAYTKLDKHEKAIDCYEKAIAIDPNFTLSYNNIGTIFQKLGNFKQSKIYFKKAIAIDPYFTDAHYNLGVIFQTLEDYKEAKNYYEKVIEINPNYINAHNNLGVMFKELGEYQKAKNCYEKAIAINPKYVDAINNFGVLFIKMCEYLKAFTYFEKIIQIEPENIYLPNHVKEIFAYIEINKTDTTILKKILLFLFRNKNIDHKNIVDKTISFLFNINNYNQTKIIFNSNTLLLSNNVIQKLLKEELFHLMLQKSLLPNIFVEKLLTKLRCEILLNLENSNNDVLNEHLVFIISLAEQCWLNEFIYAQSEKEINFINKLKNKIETNKEVNEMEMAILACYMPLNNSKKIIQNLLDYKSSNILFNNLITLLIKEPLKEKELVKSIKSLDQIVDPVSKKVQEQYEEHPYPRWRITRKTFTQYSFEIINQDIKPNFINQDNKLNNPNVLIAGCGTGNHSISATRYKNSNILAVDLSLSSLAYAKRKTEEMGYKNIEYMHADILHLNKLNKKFDVIESSGVLHHMKDPIAGLKVLVDILEPHGFLKLGLYSESGWQDVVKTKEFINKKNFKNTTEDIIICRQEIINEKKNSSLQSVALSRDFYSTSVVRDLLFHVQVHLFTIPQISKILEDFNLQFLGFLNPKPIIKKKFLNLFPEDEQNTSLDNWHQFEIDNPQFFANMYQFWVKKKL